MRRTISSTVSAAVAASALAQPVPSVVVNDDHRLIATRPLGHAHNDYEHSDPLVGSLNAGSLSIEADVHLVNGDLLVAHDADEVDPTRTLRSLYLDPLWDRFNALGGPAPCHPFGGWVRPSGVPVVLMIDFKTNGDQAWPVLKQQLRAYPGLFREVHRAAGTSTYSVVEGPVIVAISGNRPSISRLEQARTRRAAIDGGLLTDLTGRPAHLYPMVSASDNMVANAAGTGWTPNNQAIIAELADATERAQRQGRLSRVWGASDAQWSWDLMTAGGVTLINNDRPTQLTASLEARPPANSTRVMVDFGPAGATNASAIRLGIGRVYGSTGNAPTTFDLGPSRLTLSVHNADDAVDAGTTQLDDRTPSDIAGDYLRDAIRPMPSRPLVVSLSGMVPGEAYEVRVYAALPGREQTVGVSGDGGGFSGFFGSTTFPGRTQRPTVVEDLTAFGVRTGPLVADGNTATFSLSNVVSSAATWIAAIVVEHGPDVVSGDFDLNTRVDTADVSAFRVAFEERNSRTDRDANAVVNFFDVLTFLREHDEGCGG